MVQAMVAARWSRPSNDAVGVTSLKSNEWGRIVNDCGIQVVVGHGGWQSGGREQIRDRPVDSRLWDTGFPYGTLVVNLAGCFIIGLLFALADRFLILTPDVRLLLITVYLGALTTFSTFSVETINAARDGLILQAVTNILIHNIDGLAHTYLGLRLGDLRWGM
jgi:CrcB protein